MKILSAFVMAGLAVAVGAQTQTLIVDPTGVGLTYSNPGANFFDMIVIEPTGITLRALEIPTQEPAGTTGAIELWMQTVGTSHIGTEVLAAAPVQSGDPSGWELLATGNYTSAGFAVESQTCMSAFTINVPNTQLAAGTHGFAIVYVDVAHEFIGVVAYPQPPGTFADGSIEVTNGTTQATAWTAGTLNTFTFGGTNYNGTIPDFGITYDIGPVAHSCGIVELFGEGSVKKTASFFDLLEDAGPTSGTLTGTSLQLTFTGIGYVVSPGTGTYRPVSGNETAIPAIDDGENQITLPNLPVIFPTDLGPGTTMDLWVHSNGYVSTMPQSALFFVPVDPQAAMDADSMSWYPCYHDFNPAETGSGVILWEEVLSPLPPFVNPTLFITYQDVESYPATVVNPSTIQIQFDLVTGSVTYVYEVVDPVGGSTFAGGDDTMIGWSPAGPSPDPVEFDYTTLTGFSVDLPEIFPLQLDVVGDPLLGSTFDLVTSNLVGAPSLGVNLLSSAIAFPVPGFDLSILGAPVGTVAYLDVGASFLNVIDNAGVIPSIVVPNTPSLAGAVFYSQSFWWSNIVTFLGGDLWTDLLSSNGVCITIGGF